MSTSSKQTKQQTQQTRRQRAAKTAMLTVNPSCRNCEYYVASVLQCRRYPTFTIHQQNDWCGEFSLDETSV